MFNYIKKALKISIINLFIKNYHLFNYENNCLLIFSFFAI